MPEFVDRLLNKAIDFMEHHFCRPCGNCLYEICQTFKTDGNEQSAAQGTGDQKKTKMLIARTLKIEHSEKKDVWKWKEDVSDTSSEEVVEALGVTHLLIEASINFVKLSAETNYGAFLIFKTEAESAGLNASLVATISVGENQWPKKVCLKPSSAGWIPNVKRSDNWMAMELGQFRCDGDAGKADISLKETTIWKKGFIIAGIEVRPI